MAQSYYAYVVIIIINFILEIEKLMESSKFILWRSKCETRIKNIDKR